MKFGEIPEDISEELGRGERALAEGNDGMARVCARRAVGKAFVISEGSNPPRGAISATEALRIIGESGRFKPATREAARRLVTSVTETKNLPFSVHPIEDARLIISDLLRVEEV